MLQVTTNKILKLKNSRSYFLDIDWTQQKKREGTFVLDSPDSSSRPSSGRPSTSTPLRNGHSGLNGHSGSLAESKSRSASLTRIPGGRKLTTPAPVTSSAVSPGLAASDDLLAAVRQVEDTLSPLARANSQIQETIGQLEAGLLLIKSLSVGAVETNNNDSF